MHIHNESSALKSYVKLHSRHQQLPLSPSLKDVHVFTVLNTIIDILITRTGMNAGCSAAHSAAISCFNICRSAQGFRTVRIYAVTFFLKYSKGDPFHTLPPFFIQRCQTLVQKFHHGRSPVRWGYSTPHSPSPSAQFALISESCFQL